MNLLAYFFTATAFLCAVSTAAAAVFALKDAASDKNASILAWVERGQIAVTLLVTAASLVLAAAFVLDDFSFVYVAGHSDRDLPLFYKITAFWAGQEGSLLFWAWSVALCGSLFGASGAYANQSAPAKLWFWAFFLSVMAFFLLLLSSWSNPFIAYPNPPANGSGLNPMLQNPGMIFHPPLLFLGYGGFTVPACLALAHGLTRRFPANGAPSPAAPTRPWSEAARPWSEATRPFTLIAWLCLSAGIILGGWWAYMELGWGGYWAWDPVENVSLLPWLTATAYLHTGIVEARRGKLARTNIFLMALTTISAFFATYIVRGNVVRSVHAFGDSAAGLPLLLFTLVSLILAAYICLRAETDGKPLASPFSREGLLCIAAWSLLALAAITLLATLWPVISRLWSPQPVVLKASFYNYACLPFFTLLALLLSLCPWTGWDGEIRRTFPLAAVVLLMAACALTLRLLGLDVPLATASAAAGVGIIATVSMLFTARPGLLRIPRVLAAHGTHLGFALMVLGVSFSGPYKNENDLSMLPGQAYAIGEYTFTLQGVRPGDSFDAFPDAEARRAAPGASPSYIYREALLAVSRTVRNGGEEQTRGETLGILRPQSRIYAMMPGMPSREVSTLFSLGNETYATFLGMNGDAAVLRVSINPLVNWIWIGGIILCLFPLLGIRGASYDARPGARYDARPGASYDASYDARPAAPPGTVPPGSSPGPSPGPQEKKPQPPPKRRGKGGKRHA